MLFKTSKQGKGRASHYHIVYVSNGETGYTSVDMDHTHPVSLVGDVPEVLENGGHIHENIMPLIPSIELPDESDEKKIQDVIGAYKEWVGLEHDAREAGKESEAMVANDQWEESDKQDLFSKDRAALTINEIEAKIDMLSGYQRQNRTDIRYLPVEGSDQRAAEIYTILVKNILEQNNFDYEETEVFEDGMIAGRGVFNCYIDYNNNVEGDIVVEHFPWKEAVFGPHNKKDFSDGEGCIKSKWYSKARIEAMFPEKADQLQREITFYMKDDQEPLLDNPADQYAHEVADGISSPVPDKDLIDIARQEYRVIELWRRMYVKAPQFVNDEDEFVFDGTGIGNEDVGKIRTLDGFRVVDRRKPRIRVTTTASRVLLADEYPDLADQDFHLIPFYAKKKGKMFWGKVEAAKDMQREINKRHSQAVDIMNKVAAYGWFYDNSTFKNQWEKEKFKENVSSPGFVQEVLDLTKIPSQVEGVRFPTEIANMMQLDSQKIKEIMNVNLELLGQNSRAESGVAVMEKRRSQLVGNEFLYDNLSLTKRKLGRLLIKMIQKVYTTERVIRVLESRAMREAIEIGGEALLPIVPEELRQTLPIDQQLEVAGQLLDSKRAEIAEILETSDIGKFDVVVGESAFSPTMRQSNFILWAEMARNGLPVPPSLLVDLSDLPDKEKVKAQMEAMAQQQMELEQQKMQTEILKTQIAKQNQGGDSKE